MHLKSIDILGYKSFANKTHIELEPGITGIIGPNGCGKSNVMESVRWCLGEMSYKSLRADAMTDVIFSGTSKRQAMSMTEVTLTFDNSSGMLPVQFSEITVTRRIFRSGESAYFLNKTQCRLRDIKEMFLDTGLGGDGYAIIDQGGVDAMITSKPEERRAFFEEAAGVAKYNAKREEALRKLERVEMDMGRLQDSVTLISEQVKKLDNDARKAKLYAKYKEELAAAEAASILQQLTTLETELATFTQQVAPLEEMLGVKRTEMNAEGATLAAFNLEKTATQGQVIEVNQKIAELKSEIGRLEERIQSALRSDEDAKARAEAASAELASMKQRLEALVPELERAQATVVEAETARDAAQAELTSWTQGLGALVARVEETQNALELERRAALSAAEAALGRRRALAEAESAWSRQETQVRASLRELEKDLSQVAVCEGELSAARAGLEAQAELANQARQASEAAELALTEQRAKLRELSEQTMRLHSELAQSQAKAEAIEAQGGQNPYWVGAQTVVNANIPGVIGTVRQLFQVQDEAFKPYLEDLLGERLYAVVCEDSTSARSAVELLEASGKGRARFLVLSSLPGTLSDRMYPDAAKPVLRQVSFDPAHERAVRFLLGEAYALDKALFGEHWVYGGSSQKESAQLSLSDVQEVRAKVERLKVGETELTSARAACEAAISECERAVRAASAALSEQNAAERGLKAQIGEKESSLNRYARNAELSREEAARILSDMALSREKVHVNRAAIDEAAKAEEEAKAKEAVAAEAVNAVRAELQQGRATEEVLRGKLQGFAEKLSFLASAFERLNEEKLALESQIAGRGQELEELALRRTQAAEVSAQSKTRLEELNVELAAKENEAKGVFERMHELERQIMEKEGILRSLRALCDETQEQLHKLQMEVGTRTATFDTLKTRLWDEWQITFDEAKVKYAGQTVELERIEFLRKRVVSLGNVNMAAPEEYEALVVKHQFLLNQIDDLNQAKEDLKAAITKINSATRENFQKTFTEVREHFRRLYGVLFEGGEADLLLTNPEDILETGVEIVAQPPGKRLQSISLLSGGEKTLTAIALLFSFFMVKPSPFCMLDEADAALDDANVERFVGLLRQFQQQSQFLIVSHNKRTMEAADVIYGVTMEELGVSMLVSVDFKGGAKERKKKAPVAQLETQPTLEIPDMEAPHKPRTHGPFEKADTTAHEGATAVLEAAPTVTEAVAQVEETPAVEAQVETPAEATPEPEVEPVIEAAAEVVEETPVAPAEPIGMVGTVEAEAAAEVMETPEAPVAEVAEEPKTDDGTQTA